MKYIKEDLEDLIFNKNLPYTEIAKKYNVSDTYIKKIAKKLGIELKIRKKIPEGYKPHNYGKCKKYEIIKCVYCEKECNLFSKKYCSLDCQHKDLSKKKYEHFLNNNQEYCRENFNPRSFKKKFLEEQNHKCAICNMDDEWMGKILVFVLDHIDGDASNNNRNNLRLVCPNCDSQLSTFKSRNKNSARKNRYLKQKN
jgi:hypothetical protein